jgi:hypothetical protein
MNKLMKPSSQVSDKLLLALMPTLVRAERVSVAEVIEHLVEIDQRRLFLDQACGSLSAYCSERLGYSEDEAGKRVRVTRLASRLPQVLDELRSGAIHLTGLFLLAHHLTQQNYEAVLSEARGQSRRQIEQLIAARAPKPDVPQRLCQLPDQILLAGTVPTNGQGAAASCPGAGSEPEPGPGSGAAATEPGKLAPLSAARWLVQFTASAELRGKIEKARELLSHALPSGDLASLFERALDELIERETKRRLGAGKPRQRRPLSPGSRHVPVEVARQVWQRDDHQCTFIDTQGRRCSSRRFLTLEHRQPVAPGGAPTVDNLCLLCASHNAHEDGQVFGECGDITSDRTLRQDEVIDEIEPSPGQHGNFEGDQRGAASLVRLVGSGSSRALAP